MAKRDQKQPPKKLLIEKEIKKKKRQKLFIPGTLITWHKTGAVHCGLNGQQGGNQGNIALNSSALVHKHEKYIYTGILIGK